VKVTHFQLSKVGLNVDLYLSKYETLQLSEEDCFHVETQFSSACTERVSLKCAHDNFGRVPWRIISSFGQILN